MITHKLLGNMIGGMISEYQEESKKLEEITASLHTVYYGLFPNDNRNLNRLRKDYPLCLLKAIVNKELWEEEEWKK